MKQLRGSGQDLADIQALEKGVVMLMQKIDMSPKAVTTRLKRVSQLRPLGLAMQKATIKEDPKTNKTDREGTLPLRSPTNLKNR